MLWSKLLLIGIPWQIQICLIFFVPLSLENFFGLFLSYPSFKQACAVGTKACHVIQIPCTWGI